MWPTVLAMYTEKKHFITAKPLYVSKWQREKFSKHFSGHFPGETGFPTALDFPFIYS